MARYVVTIDGDGLQESQIKKALKTIGDKAAFNIKKDSPPKSRAQRFDSAISQVGDAKSEMESLRDELQEWYDNLPESFQSGTKGDELQSAIDELEDAISRLEEAEDASVEFPGMY